MLSSGIESTASTPPSGFPRGWYAHFQGGSDAPDNVTEVFTTVSLARHVGTQKRAGEEWTFDDVQVSAVRHPAGR